MKRNEFLSWSFLAAMVVALPGRVKAALRSIRRDDKGFKVDAGTDRYDNILKPFGGDQFFCKVAGRDSDGDSYIYESTRNTEGGPLLHVHYEQDEWWYVLEGDYLIKVGDTVYEAKPGDRDAS
jgi:mannose-6-phosphate isomerase-like protein (cupin superfamily)